MPVKPQFVACVALSCWPCLAGAAEACRDLLPNTPVVHLVGLDPLGDPLLADGRSLRLVGLAPRQDAVELARFSSEIARWQGLDVRLVAAGELDRWGRLPARLLVEGQSGAEPRDLATVLVGAGAAAAMPEAAHAGCGVPERSVRPAPSQPAPARRPPATVAAISAGSLDGHDIAALKAHAGRVVAMEGRIASVGERAQRTYLNFSRRRAEAGSIVMPKRLWRKMQDGGWTAATLTGKRVRARGVLSGQDGLLLDLTSALALDVID